MKRKRRRPRKHHHQLAIADRLLARSAQRSIARTPGNRVLNLIARQPSIMKLRLNEAHERFRGGLLHRVAKVGHGDLRFPHEEIGALEQLMGLLHQFPGILASLASSMPYDFGGVAARVEVLTYRLDQFRLTTRTDRSFVRLETVCGVLVATAHRLATSSGKQLVERGENNGCLRDGRELARKQMMRES